MLKKNDENINYILLIYFIIKYKLIWNDKFWEKIMYNNFLKKKKKCVDVLLCCSSEKCMDKLSANVVVAMLSVYKV